MTTKQYTFWNRSADRRYFTILPNLLWQEELALTVYDITLYATIKRIAGENGTCYMSTSNLATTAKMSAGQVSKSKTRLAQQGLIEITTRRRSPQGHPIDHITILDVWERNTQACCKRSPGEHTSPTTQPDRSPDEPDRSPGELDRSPGELEEDHMNKNVRKKTKQQKKNTPSTTGIPNLDIYNLLSEMGIQEPNLTILSSLGFRTQEVRAWILYVQTQNMPAWRGYLVNRLKHLDPPPPEFLQLASLSQVQLDTLATLSRSRHWMSSWDSVSTTLAQERIDKELAELWYQTCGKEST